MKKGKQNGNDVLQGDKKTITREVKVTSYTIKGKSRTAYCDVVVMTDDQYVVEPGDAISKDEKDYDVLLRRAEAVGYARCLARLANAQGNVISSDEADNKE